MASRVKLSKIQVKAMRSRSPLYKDYNPINEDDSDDIHSSDSSDGTPIFSPPNIGTIGTPSVSIDTKLKKIEQGKSAAQLKRKKRLKHNKSLRDWWLWYWEAPKAHFPILYFLLVFICCVPLSCYWFIDNNTAFIVCGAIGLSMFGYAAHKFRISIKLKKEIDKYAHLNFEMKKENRILKAQIDRFVNAHHMLQQTRARLTRANHRNRKNLKKFQQVELNLKLVGKKAHTKLSDVHQMTNEIWRSWHSLCITAERDMLYLIFERFNRNRANTPYLTREEFKEFHEMLPQRYSDRFKRVATFHTFSGGKRKIDLSNFVNTLDTFALMETDDKDMEFMVTPSISETPDIASFTFVTSDVYDGGDDDENTPSSEPILRKK